MPPKNIPRPEKGQTFLQLKTWNSNKSDKNESTDKAEHATERENWDPDSKPGATKWFSFREKSMGYSCLNNKDKIMQNVKFLLRSP